MVPASRAGRGPPLASTRRTHVEPLPIVARKRQPPAPAGDTPRAGDGRARRDVVMTIGRLLVATALAACAASCGNDSPATVTSPTSVNFRTEYFSDVIDSGGRLSNSFTVNTAGPVTITLASVVNADSGLPIGRPLRLGAGRLADTECQLQTSSQVQAALTTQVTYLATEGLNCIEVADTAGLPGPIRFAIRFTHP